MFMEKKVFLLFAFLCISCLGLNGCGKKSCTLTVVSSYSGSDELGQDLGSGKFSETISVSEGDILYENYSGEWVKDRSDCYEIIEIKKISDNGVVILLDEKEIELGYKRSKQVGSTYVVYDGINYSYSISFSKEE